ncbi:hypothetical protein [Candidatus Enterovibrio altilux]|uniref:Transposase n=1 Tax=Candidatus Enterovibrio altilux TaxID=1927128 RepID=A0A291B8R6_9GAMM|nr:hypothetical protein [Candidatus Enterovibrio luxaltus]ATF09398.1 Transposase [Candidatus Enterovibrio luxaltus]
MHDIIIAELSVLNLTGGEVLPNLLKETSRKVNKISGDGVYDTRQSYEIIRIKRAVSLIPLRTKAIFGA